MREELVKLVYKKSKLEIREKRARIVACCCKDVVALIAEAEDEMAKEEEIKKRLRRGITMDLDKKLGREDQIKLDALHTLKAMGTVGRDKKKLNSKIWSQELPEEENKNLPTILEELDTYRTNIKTKHHMESEDSSKIYKNSLYIYIYINIYKFIANRPIVNMEMEYERIRVESCIERIPNDDIESNRVKMGEYVKGFKLPPLVKEEIKLGEGELESIPENLSQGKIVTEQHATSNVVPKKEKSNVFKL